MYPNYYPFDQYYLIPNFTQYPIDSLNYFPISSFNFAEVREQANPKQEQVNTNYTINGNSLNSNEIQPQAIEKKPRTNFRPPNSLQKLNKNAEKNNNIINENAQRCKGGNKNYESNIINKIFSFLWSQDKSKIYVQQILKDKIKVNIYFDFIKTVRKYCKRYINKEYLANLCDYKLQHIAYRIVTKQTEKLKYFSMTEFSSTIRKLNFIYLNKVCVTSILTSKKMRSCIWKDHFSKMRNIKKFLFNDISPQEYDQMMLLDEADVYREMERQLQEQKKQIIKNIQHPELQPSSHHEEYIKQEK